MNWINDQLLKIESKIDRLDARIDSVDVTLGKQSIILEDHTRRSLANEKHVDLLKKKLEEDLKPVKAHVDMVNWVFKLVGGCVVVVQMVNGLMAWIKPYVH